MVRAKKSVEYLRLQAEARSAREQYQLYKARTFGPRPVDPARLRELEQACESAEARLNLSTDAAEPTT